MDNFNQRFSLKILTIILFLLCFTLGIWLSLHKPFWGDEIRSQTLSVQNYSFTEILAGKIKGEGNISPLFYLIQKALSALFVYRIPSISYEDYIWDTKGQIILRLSPNIFMSLTITLIFYFFARYYSIKIALFSLGVSLSSFIFLHYWAEARHYAQWIFLTTAQSLIFLKIFNSKENKQPILHISLAFIHILLSLTIFYSIFQILIFSFFLWRRQKLNILISIKKYFFLTILPLGICLFYYLLKDKIHHFWFQDTFLGLIYPSIPPEYLTIIGIYLVVTLLLVTLKKSSKDIAGFQLTRNYLLITALMLAASFFIMLKFKSLSVKGNFLQNETIHLVHPRYFLYLTPLGNIAIVLIFHDLLNLIRTSRWLKFNIVLLFIGLLILEGFKTYINILEEQIYFF